MDRRTPSTTVPEGNPQRRHRRDPGPLAGWHPGVPLGDLLNGGHLVADHGDGVPLVPIRPTHPGGHADGLTGDPGDPGDASGTWVPDTGSEGTTTTPTAGGTGESTTTAWASGDTAAILASVPSWLRARVGARWLVAGLAGIVAGGWLLLALLQGGGPQVDPVIPLATAIVSDEAGQRPDDPVPDPPDAPNGVGDDPNDDRSGDGGVITAHIAGAVARPGIHSLGSGARIADLVAAAGGETPDADLDRLNLAAVVPDGARVWVPRQGEALPPEVLDPVVGTPVPAAGGGGSQVVPPGTGGGRISLNRADATELEGLPGIGPATAAAIVAHRDQHGPFPSVEALEAVRGIGPSKMEALRDLVET